MEKTLDDLFFEREIEKNVLLRESTAKEQAVYVKHPALERLERKKRTLIMDELENVIKTPENKDTIKEIFFLRLKEIEDSIAAYRVQHNLTDAAVYTICPLCGDSGYVGANLCVCMKEKAYIEIFGGEDIARLEGSFSEFSEQSFPEANGQRERMTFMKRFFQEYAQDFPKNEKKQLLLIGTAGLGKSYLLSALLKELKKKERDVCCMRALRLFDCFHKHRLGEGSIDLLYNAAVLAIDDLGSEPMTQNVTREYFFDLLCHRERGGLHTMLITNNTFSQIKERYTEKTSSRLFGGKSSQVIRFLGEDVRLSPT